MAEHDEERGFTIVDKRAREEEPEEEPPQEMSLPEVEFTGFVLSLGTSALMHLGLVANPETGEPAPPNLPVARHTIDTLELLQVKTKGNLSDEEETLLENLLAELRMRFVEASRS